MGDERVGRQRQNLVEDEQGQQVLGEGDADGGRNGHGEEEIETGLVDFMVATHVANSVERCDNPQTRCDQAEQHPQRLDAESQRQAGQHLQQLDGRSTPSHDFGQDRQDHEKSRTAGHQGDGFAQVGPSARQQYQRAQQ